MHVNNADAHAQCTPHAQLLLYAVTGEATTIDDLADALRGGATMVQLRKKHLADDALLAFAAQANEITRCYGVPLIINDRADIAKAADATGVHLGQGDGSIAAARALLGSEAIIGVTARTVAQALAAEAAGADYLGSGAVFGTGTKANAVPLPLPRFRDICAAVHIPVTAIGGITAHNIAQLQGCGMAGFAVVSGIFGAADVVTATRRLRRCAEEIIL
jgi:thiamine-phosphate diphosphorylase